MTNTWTVRVPQVAEWLTANQRIHHMAAARRVKQWRGAAFYASVAAKTPTGLDVVRVDTEFVFAGRAPVREIENLRPTLKAIVDGAIGPRRGPAPGRGIVPDDSDAHLTYGEYVARTAPLVGPGRELVSYVLLTITQVAPPPGGHNFQDVSLVGRAEWQGRSFAGRVTQRRCATCGRWETDESRALPCVKPRIRIR